MVVCMPSYSIKSLQGTFGLQHLPSEERPRDVVFFNPESRRFQGELIAAFHLRGGCQEEGARLIMKEVHSRTKADGHELKQGSFCPGTCKGRFLTLRTVK